MITLLKFLKIRAVIGNKIKWAAILTEQPIQLIRCKMQLFKICAIAIVVNIDTEIFQQCRLFGGEVQILDQSIRGVFKIIAKGTHHCPLAVGATEIMVNQH